MSDGNVSNFLEAIRLLAPLIGTGGLAAIIIAIVGYVSKKRSDETRQHYRKPYGIAFAERSAIDRLTECAERNSHVLERLTEAHEREVAVYQRLIDTYDRLIDAINAGTDALAARSRRRR